MNTLPPGLYLYAILLILLTGFHHVLYAQDEKKFTAYTTADGLSNSSITGIAQDDNGYLWVSTLRGLNRYDGKHFVQFHAGSKDHSLPDETVTRLTWLGKNRLAAYTSMGLHIIDTKSGGRRDLIVPAHNAKYLYKFNSVMSVLGDEQGNVYLLGRSGFYHYNSDHELVFRFDYYTKAQTLTETFGFGSFLCRLSARELLLITIDGAYIYNTQKRRLDKINDKHPLLPELGTWPHGYLVRQPAPGQLLIIQDSSNAIIFVDSKLGRKIVSVTRFPTLLNEFNWRSNLFRINDSLFYLTSGRKGFFKLHIVQATGKVTIDTTRYFSGYLCTDFVAGHDNRLWVATTTGLLKETKQLVPAQQIPMPAWVLKQTPGLRIKQILCYKDKIYVGCLGNGGLLVFDKKTGGFLYKVNFEKYHSPNDMVSSIVQARNDTLFIGNHRLIWLKTGTRQTGEMPLPGWDAVHNWISYLYKDSHGNIWATSNDNSKIYVLDAGAHSFRRMDYSRTMLNDLLVPYGICEDQGGNIWMRGHGVCRVNRLSRMPDLYMDSFPYMRFPRREITAFTIDKNNTLWAGINNNGLAAYNIGKGTFRYFTTHEGLPDNYINAMYAVNNTMWLATASGMASLNMLTGDLAKFSSSDGFSLLPVSVTDLFYDTATHYMYGGFTDHLVRFHTDSISYSQSPPSFFIESVHFFNDTTWYHPHGIITMPYYKNDIAVTVGGICYDDISNQQIEYRIADSKDNAWKVLTGNIINFNNLPAGNYRLQVKLSATNNRWPPLQKEIIIVITLPFWKTPWFMALVIGALLAIIYLIYRQNINVVRSERSLAIKREELATINEHLAEAQLTALQAQMNPHFIFNALNSIKRMILDNENRNASRYLSRFAQMIRLTLNHSKETFVTLQETIEYLHAYLEMEQLRFGSSFSYIIETAGITDEEEINIPTLMIQPLVENAIWHGLMHRSGDKKIIIRFEQTGNRVTCIIEDNGIGIRQSEKMKRENKPPSVGLDNLRNRIMMLNEKYKMNCSLTITDRSEADFHQTGTRAVLQFKLLI